MDYPGTTISDSGTQISSCNNIDDIYGANGLTLKPSILYACKYLKRSENIESRYTFHIGSGVSCKACSDAGVTPIISMTGRDNAGIYKDTCACMDALGMVYKEAV